MNDAQVYEMQVQLWKPNTWGVTEGELKYDMPVLLAVFKKMPTTNCSYSNESFKMINE
jgi:hypothetical protein